MPRLRQNDKIETLKNVPLFADLAKKHLIFLSRHVTETPLQSGTVLAREGDIGREAMFIVSGAASVHRNGTAIAELGPGDVLGEMSLITRAPRNATVTAESDMVVLVMNSREFADVLRSSPDISLRILKTVATRLERSAA